MAVDGINLSRFDPLTRILLQRWDVAPLYALNGQTLSIGTTSASLTATSSFRLPGTTFSPAYAVFQPNASQTTPYDRGQVVTLNDAGALSLQSDSRTRVFSRPLSLSFPVASSGFGVSFEANVPASAPSLPASLRERTQYFSITDARFDALLNGPDFIIPNAGPFGLRVLTDGAGGVDGVETVLTTQSLLNNVYFNTEGSLAAASAGVYSPPASPAALDSLSLSALLPLPDVLSPDVTGTPPETDTPAIAPLRPGAPTPVLSPAEVTRTPQTSVEESLALTTPSSSLPAPSIFPPEGNAAILRNWTLSPPLQADIAHLRGAATLTHPGYARPAADLSAYMPMAAALPGPTRTRAETGDIGATLDQAFQLGATLSLHVTGSRAQEGGASLGGSSGEAGSGMGRSPRRERRFEAQA